MSGKAKAICYMIFSSGSFAFMNAFVRLAGDMPSVEKSFFRNLVAAFVALAILLREGQGFAIKKGTLPFHLGRSTSTPSIIWYSPTPPCSTRCPPFSSWSSPSSS